MRVGIKALKMADVMVETRDVIPAPAGIQFFYNT